MFANNPIDGYVNGSMGDVVDLIRTKYPCRADGLGQSRYSAAGHVGIDGDGGTPIALLRQLPPGPCLL
jgi:hypothetical protein